MKKLSIALALLLTSLNAHAVVGMAIGYAVGSASSSTVQSISNEVDLRKPTLICAVRNFDDTKCRQGKYLQIGQYVYSKGYKHYRPRSYIIQHNLDYLVLDVWN